MKPTPPTKEEQVVWSDLARKASLDVRVAMNTTLELAAMTGGPAAMTSVILHVAGSNIVSLATLFEIQKAFERNETLSPGGRVSDDAFLVCCLFVAAGHFNVSSPDRISATAVEMFRKLTGRDPDLPIGWTKTTGGAP